MPAVELAESVWLVGTGDAGSPAFTDAHDCAQYLVWRDGSGYLVDTGTGRGTDRLLENVASVADPESLAGVLVTHCHADHGGGAAALSARGMRVYASGHTARALETADEEVTQLARARRAGLYPADYTLTAAAGLTALDGVCHLPLTWGTLTALPSPGHCDGHLTFVLEADGCTSLFSGDVVFAGGLIAVQAIADCRPDEYADTVIGLDELDADRLFPGHGEPVLDGAGADIARAATAFRALLPPPNRLVAPGFESPGFESPGLGRQGLRSAEGTHRRDQPSSG